MKIVFRMIPHWSFVLLYLFCVIESCEKVYLTGADSFHCRCNSTNCDFLEFELPKPAEYLLVTSDKSKLRFSKYNSAISKESNGGTPVNLYEAGQKLRGFGGAITDAMLLELFKLSENARNNAIEAWFGGNGAHYTTIRIPIGGTDFSSFPYSLDEVEDDFELEHFALTKIDLELRIPVMEHAKRISEHQIDYLASSWSSPKWLKNSNEFNGFGKLKGEAGDKYHKTWANYHVKEIVVNYASPIEPDQPSA